MTGVSKVFAVEDADTAVSSHSSPQQQDAIPQEFLQELHEQAQHPPGADDVIGACYQATLDLLHEDPTLRTYIASILSARSFTPHHFTNLYFRAIQFLELFAHPNPDYPEAYTKASAWKPELRRLITYQADTLKNLLLTKDTTTTIYQRYAGSMIVLNALFPRQKLKVSDFGCGGNYGLRGLSKHLPFGSIIDDTRDHLPTSILNRNYTLSEGLAVDKENPDEPLARSWRFACSFYPKELDTMPRLLALEQKVKDAPRVSFLQADLLQSNVSLPRKHFDAVLLNTLLYQLTPSERETVIARAKESIHTKGYLIVQDFAIKRPDNPHSLDFRVSWFGKPYMYRTFLAGEKTAWEWQEILQWENGRCRHVREGEDFTYILLASIASSE